MEKPFLGNACKHHLSAALTEQAQTDMVMWQTYALPSQLAAGVLPPTCCILLLNQPNLMVHKRYLCMSIEVTKLHRNYIKRLDSRWLKLQALNYKRSKLTCFPSKSRTDSKREFLS